MNSPGSSPERAQVGIRLEKRLTKVLKGLAEYLDVSLNVLVESILLHAVAADDQVMPPPWRNRKSRMVCANLMEVYGLVGDELADLALLGIEVDRDSPRGQLLLALRQGRDDAALAILEAQPELKDACDAQGFPVIISAARLDSLPLLDWCLGHGVDAETKDEVYEDSAVGWAVFYGNERSVRHLIARGVYLSNRDNEGFTPLANARRGAAGQLAKFGVRAPSSAFAPIIAVLQEHGAED
ncbi:MAG: ankyrin repeat domain-containing protein [Planctomycetota bacterium]|nr:MAG: ankyrin repeat domain-containing protein [Planctomycetota bacterium]